jgi:hypothetical protein
MTASGLLSPHLPLPGSFGSLSTRSSSTQLGSKVNSIISTSYADVEFRDVLSLVDERGLANTAETRRRLRLSLQREVLESNCQIVAEFGHVAEVGWRRWVCSVKVPSGLLTGHIFSNFVASGQPSEVSIAPIAR